MPAGYYRLEIAGADGRFVPAQTHLQESTLTLTAANVPQPRAVRYAWYDNPPVSLFNTAGLPAAPFKRDAQQETRTQSETQR